MDYCAGIGISINTARFIPTNTFFKKGNITEERTVEHYELVLFLRNGGYAVINGKKYPITAGSVRFHRPGDRVYSFRFNEIYVVHFIVDNEEKGKEIFKVLPSFINLPDMENQISIFKKLIAALVLQDDFECVYYLWQLLGKIKAQFQIQQKNNKEHFVTMMKKYIEEHLSQPLGLEEIAKNFHMHPIYLHRKFKNATGLTPSNYLKNVRLSKAKTYLLTTDLSVDDISTLCGFCNASYFIKVFKKQMSCTPHQFRNQSALQI